jgi:hypothetical protein
LKYLNSVEKKGRLRRRSRITIQGKSRYKKRIEFPPSFILNTIRVTIKKYEKKLTAGLFRTPIIIPGAKDFIAPICIFWFFQQNSYNS